jgi:hypothetical protein
LSFESKVEIALAHWLALQGKWRCPVCCLVKRKIAAKAFANIKNAGQRIYRKLARDHATPTLEEAAKFERDQP